MWENYGFMMKMKNEAEFKEKEYRKESAKANTWCLVCHGYIYLSDLNDCEVIVTKRKKTHFIHKKCIGGKPKC